MKQTTEIKKGTIILYEGNICKNAYHVIKGCLKSYVIDKNGKEHIIQFAPEGWYISDLDSLVNGVPSKTFIDAIENSIVEKINFEDLENINDIKSSIQENFYKKLTNSIISLNKRLISQLASNSEERYIDFLHTYPSLTNRLPLKLVAAYIGITPEYLSEIRRNISKK